MDTPLSKFTPAPTLASNRAKCGHCSSFTAAVLALVFGLFSDAALPAVSAHILLPTGVYEWSGAAGTSAWADAANWVGGAVPPDEAEVLFGNAPSGSAGEAKSIVNAFSNRKLRSLWFESGFDYTLSGDSLWLGDTLADGGRLITVLNRINRHSEIAINAAVNVTTLNPSRAFVIHNDSLGGLRFNGDFNTGGHEIRVEGSAGVRFSGAISGVSGGAAGELRVKMNGGHAVFAADNSAWGGTIHVDSGMAVVTANGALGSTALATTVADGATLAFRQPNWGQGPSVNYTSEKTLHISGAGVWRWGLGNVGALYSDGGRNRFAGNIVLMGDAAIGARTDYLRLSGAITGNGSLTKVGQGIVSLANAGNAYTGATIIREGGLWIENEAALQGGFKKSDTGTNIVLDGGVLVFSTDSNGNTDFTRQLGTGPGQIQWTGSGGFANGSGFGAYLRLTNEDGVNAGTLTWGKGGFVPLGSALLFGTESAGGIVSLRNSIDLAGGQREIRVHRNTISEVIGDITNGALVKTGDGTFILRNKILYTGPTIIRGGALIYTQATSASNFQLNGGTLMLGSSSSLGAVSVNLGAGGGLIQWLAGSDGGIAVFGGIEQTLRFNGSQKEITWGQQYFVGLDNTLILGHRDNSPALILDTALNLAGGERTIRVIDTLTGSAEAKRLRAELKFTQALRNGSLRLVGDGRADMAVANDALAGSVTVESAELRLNEGGTLASIRALRVARAGTVTLDNAGTHNAETGGLSLGNRLRDAATVTLDAGTLRFWGSDASDTISSETIGAVTLAGGDNRIDVVNRSSGASGSTTLTLRSLNRSAPNATIHFTNSAGTGDYTSAVSGPRLRFTNAPSLSGGILPWATVSGSQPGFNGTHWASVTGDGYLVAYGDYHTGAPSTWTAADNASVNQTHFGIGQLKVNSLRFQNSATLNFQFPNASTVLDIVSGGILSANGGYLHLGRVTTSADLLHIHVASPFVNSQFDVSSEIFGEVGLVKSGKGRLLLWGEQPNTYTGTTYVNEGTLALNKAAGANAIEGDVVVGDFSGSDILMIASSDQIADTATVTLRGVWPKQTTKFGGLHEGILQFNNGNVSAGIREAFHRLHVEGRGVLNFIGGEIGQANYLYLNTLTFADSASRLVVNKYVEFTDYILVRRTANVAPILGQIIFTDYGPARLVHFDENYMRITPFPEPATYGAIFGLAGLALWGFRKKEGLKRRAQGFQKFTECVPCASSESCLRTA